MHQALSGLVTSTKLRKNHFFQFKSYLAVSSDGGQEEVTDMSPLSPERVRCDSLCFLCLALSI